MVFSFLFFLVLTILEGLDYCIYCGHKSLYRFWLSKLVFSVFVGLEYILRFLRIYIYVRTIAEGLDYCCGSLLYVMVLSLYMGSRYRSGLHYLLGSSFIIVVSLYYTCILKFPVSLFVLTIEVGLHFHCGSSVYFVFFSLFLCWSSVILWKFRFFVECDISFVGERFCIVSLVTSVSLF